MNKSRIPYLDNIKGFLTLLVVFAHFLYEYQSIHIVGAIVNAIYFFHMPAFVFSSGYLSKSNNARSRRALIKLIAIYLVFNGLLMLMVGRSQPNATAPYKSMWYILALVIWRLTVNKLSNIKHIFWIMVCFTFVIGLWPSINNTFALARIIAFYPFFLIGYMMNEESLYDRFINRGKNKYLYGSLCLVAAIVLWFLCNTFLQYSQHQYLMEHYKVLHDVPARLSMFIVSWLMIFTLFSLMPNKSIYFLTKIGRHSLAVFLCHYPIVLLFRRYFIVHDAQSLLFVSLISTVVLSVLLSSDVLSHFISRYFETMTVLICGETEKVRGSFACFVKISGIIIGIGILVLPLLKYIIN